MTKNVDVQALYKRRTKLEAVAKDNSGASAAERTKAKQAIAVIRIQLGEIPPDVEAWNADVERGRKLLAIAGKSQWELGELAASVGKKYGEGNLAKFAKEIKCPLRTLENCRATWRAWFGNDEIPRQRGISDYSKFPVAYETAAALNAYDKRWEYISKHPNETREDVRIFMRGLNKPLSPAKNPNTGKLVKQVIKQIDNLIRPRLVELLSEVQTRELEPEEQKDLTAAFARLRDKIDKLQSGQVIKFKPKRSVK